MLETLGMAIQEGNRRPITHAGIREARSRANKVTLSQLNAMVKHDPAADMSDFLRQESTSYPRLVEELAGSFVSSISNIKTNCDAPPSIETGLLDLPMDGSIKVIRSLSPSIFALAQVAPEDDKQSGSISKEKAAALNQAIRRGEVLFQLLHTFVIGIGPSHVVKVTPSLDPDHINNTLFLAAHIPELPIPRCLGALGTNSSRKYMFMSRACDTTLESIWPELSTAQKSSVQEQLNCLFRILRTQQSVECVRLGGFLSGVCKDMRRTHHASSKPVQTEAEFNDFLFQHPRRTVTPWVKMIRSFMRDDHRMVMTHGDLHPRNIMVTLEPNKSPLVEEDTTQTREQIVRVTSILDWENAGWYPEYWEFVKAASMANARGPLRDWVNFLPTDAIGTFPVEFSIDRLLDRWLG